jgi:hypothetical protein
MYVTSNLRFPEALALQAAIKFLLLADDNAGLSFTSKDPRELPKGILQEATPIPFPVDATIGIAKHECKVNGKQHFLEVFTYTEKSVSETVLEMAMDPNHKWHAVSDGEILTFSFSGAAFQPYHRAVIWRPSAAIKELDTRPKRLLVFEKKVSSSVSANPAAAADAKGEKRKGEASPSSESALKKIRPDTTPAPRPAGSTLGVVAAIRTAASSALMPPTAAAMSRVDSKKVSPAKEAELVAVKSAHQAALRDLAAAKRSDEESTQALAKARADIAIDAARFVQLEKELTQKESEIAHLRAELARTVDEKDKLVQNSDLQMKEMESQRTQLTVDQAALLAALRQEASDSKDAARTLTNRVFEQDAVTQGLIEQLRCANNSNADLKQKVAAKETFSSDLQHQQDQKLAALNDKLLKSESKIVGLNEAMAVLDRKAQEQHRSLEETAKMNHCDTEAAAELLLEFVKSGTFVQNFKAFGATKILGSGAKQPDREAAAAAFAALSGRQAEDAPKDVWRAESDEN